MPCDKDSQAELTMEVKKRNKAGGAEMISEKVVFTALFRQVGERQDGNCQG